MDVPLVTALRAGPRARPAAVARALARGLAPEEAEDAAPAWLRAGQEVAFRRALAALRRHGGALLADPPGSGKTYVALAVAEALDAGPVACLVPAVLRTQWREALRRTGVAGMVGSHEMASRGRLPDACGAVIIDESHHFRHATIRRYGLVADWTLGRPVLLLSATPVVNRAEDLGRQLRLGARDDALAPRGLPSLLAPDRGSPSALGGLVVTRTRVSGLPPERARRTPPAGPHALEALLAGMDRLRLSNDPGVASLLRTGLHRALASSPAALSGALGRYRALLLQARDAADAGRVAGRSVLRALGGSDGTQVVMWTLFPSAAAAWELALDDEPALAAIAGLARAATLADPKADLLADLVSDGRPTIVFSAFRDTALALRASLPRAAWITGDAAGVGPVRTGRAAALAPFRRSGGPAGGEPCVLLATDVAAEGLDLRGVSRVVHYDLPWTDVRLVQRAGRARRLDAGHAVVEVVTVPAPEPLERRLGLAAVLAAKRGVADQLLRSPPWSWGAALAELVPPGSEAIAGVAVVEVADQEEAGVLAGLRVEEAGDPPEVVASWLGWRADGRRGGGWSTAGEDVVPRLAALLAPGAAGGDSGWGQSPPCLPGVLEDLAAEAARLLRRCAAVRLGGVPRTPGAAALRDRLLAEATRARRSRDRARLARLEAWLGFLARGHTAGEARLVERVAGSAGSRDPFTAAPPGADPGTGGPPAALEVRLTGIVVFQKGG